MNKKKLFIAALGILLLASVTIQRMRPNNSPNRQNVLSSQTQNFSVTQKVLFENGKQDTATISATANQSALDILSNTKNVTIKQTSMGKLVESIEGVKNGTDDKYWIYYVNGKVANVGAAEYKVQADDSIEWKFQAYEQ